MLLETCQLAQREIRRNVMRSTLTILGIVIGVASVIVMVTLGGGATAKVTSDISRMGSNMLQIRPGEGMHRPGGARSSADPFNFADITAIEREITGLKAVAPMDTTTGQAIYGNENRSTSIIGSTNEFLVVRDWEMEAGRLFTAGEIRAGKAVCLLGSTVQKTLFGNENPIGTSIRLGKIAFKVIGVLKAKGQSAFGTDQDDIVLIPHRTLQRRIVGNTDIHTIMVSVRYGVSTNRVKTRIEGLMRERRRVTAGKEDNFYVRDMKEIIETVTGTTRVMTALLGAVAGVSLLVGGIGIMNIMLVSVTERTREIGIRLAIGALERDVLLQFLMESVVLSSFGGVCGILLGLVTAFFSAQILRIPFVWNGWIVLISFVFTAAVGIIFGYVPARKAACLDPIEALRHE
jgi:putative ABC transport system permease protein